MKIQGYFLLFILLACHLSSNMATMQHLLCNYIVYCFGAWIQTLYYETKSDAPWLGVDSFSWKFKVLATQLDDAHFLSSGASIIQSLTKLLSNRFWYISIIMSKSCRVHMFSMQLQSSKARHNWEITVYAQTLFIIKLSISKTAAIYMYPSFLGARPLRLPTQAQGQLLLLGSQSFSSRISVPQQNSCNWWDCDLWNVLLK